MQYPIQSVSMSIPKIITIITLLLSILSCCSTRTTNRLQSQTDVEKSEQSEQYKTGKVIKVLDGDTFELLMEGNETVKVRMEGIDAPEGGMPYYRVAKNYLSDLCAGKEVTIEIKEKDHYGRYIALTYLEDGRELSHEMVRAGLAWHYKQHDDRQSLADLEIEAREAKRGLWKEKNPMSPWTARGLRRKGVSTKDSFNIQGDNQ
ncbi:MAG: thermonuclease family protein [Bacteroidales bacterium]|jgi:micrococcal nuclease|nr:thermonuclease family protein [Bacteroidales bacterium]